MSKTRRNCPDSRWWGSGWGSQRHKSSCQRQNRGASPKRGQHITARVRQSRYLRKMSGPVKRASNNGYRHWNASRSCGTRLHPLAPTPSSALFAPYRDLPLPSSWARPIPPATALARWKERGDCTCAVARTRKCRNAGASRKRVPLACCLARQGRAREHHVAAGG